MSGLKVMVMLMQQANYLLALCVWHSPIACLASAAVDKAFSSFLFNQDFKIVNLTLAKVEKLSGLKDSDFFPDCSLDDVVFYLSLFGT